MLARAPDRFVIMPVSGLEWSDLGDPGRVVWQELKQRGVLERTARSIETVTPRFSARRVLKQYVTELYLPAIAKPR